jgi:hypothetical protein
VSGISGTQTYTITCTGANGTSATDSVTVITQTTYPTVTLNANPASITSGQQSTLIWSSTNATYCYGSGGGWYGTKSTSGGETVTPYQTTTYTITCNDNSGHQVTAQTTVVVNNACVGNNCCNGGNCGGTPTLTLYANPTSVNQGQSSVLTWYSSNVNYCTASGGWNGSQNINGSQTVNPYQTTTYYLNCTGNNGSVSAQATVFVNSQGNLPTVNLYASQQSVTSGQTATLSWMVWRTRDFGI